MSTIHNNLQPNQNNVDTGTSTSTGVEGDDGTQVASSGTAGVHHRALLTAGEMAQTDTLQTPPVGVRGNVLSTKPPAVHATQTSKPQDLETAQRRIDDMTKNFAHPATGALILASEQGVSAGGKQLAGESAGGTTSQTSSSAASAAPSNAATTNYAVAGNSSGSSASITQSALSPSTSSASGASSTSGTISQAVATDLDSSQNNPVSDAANSLISSASELPTTEGKCQGKKNGATENKKTNDIQQTTGLSNDQSRTLLRAMNQNNSANGTVIANSVTNTEQTVIASSIETLQQLRNKGQGNSEAAKQIQSELGSVADTLKNAKGGALTGNPLTGYRSALNNLVTDVQQVGKGATGSLSAPSAASAPTLVGPQLVDPNNP